MLPAMHGFPLPATYACMPCCVVARVSLFICLCAICMQLLPVTESSADMAVGGFISLGKVHAGCCNTCQWLRQCQCVDLHRYLVW